MVRLTRIYTRTGDAGQTQLSDLSHVSKTDPRVEAYGDVDEANSAIGVALAASGLPSDLAAVLRTVQNEMFDVGADLSNRYECPLRPIPYQSFASPRYHRRPEAWCDQFGEPLPELEVIHPSWRFAGCRAPAPGAHGGAARPAGRLGRR